jgi:tryptophan synthase alpha chain
VTIPPTSRCSTPSGHPREGAAPLRRGDPATAVSPSGEASEGAVEAPPKLRRIGTIEATFARLRVAGARALVPYFTAGDPDLDTTRRLVEEAAARGADLIELGLPFSDPLADGPVIQRAGARALAGGVSLARLLPVIADVAGRVRTPLCLMTYLNPLYRHGFAATARDVARAGVAGLIVPDLPVDESGPLARAAARVGLDLVLLASPTSGPARLRRIARQSRGFVYLVPVTGITGERSALPPDLIALVRDLRAVTTKPICVGFGIATPAHVAEVVRYADGAIVGSAIVRLVEERRGDPDLVGAVGDFIAALKAATAVDGGTRAPAG